MLEVVNDKVYPMWNQFIEKKEEWIGGTLLDEGDSMDQGLGLAGEEGSRTKITDITLTPNGETSAFFSIVGEDFNCGFDVGVGGISCQPKGEPWLTLSGYGGHTFHICKKVDDRETKQRTETRNRVG